MKGDARSAATERAQGAKRPSTLLSRAWHARTLPLCYHRESVNKGCCGGSGFQSGNPRAPAHRREINCRRANCVRGVVSVYEAVTHELRLIGWNDGELHPGLYLARVGSS